MVAENIIRQETKGFEEAIDTKFDMLEGGQYTLDMPAQQLPSVSADPKTPLTLLEARNAVAIAKAAGAAQYAPDSLQKAQDYLNRAEDYLQRKQGKTPIGTAARGATQMAEDARVLTLRRKEQERIAARSRPCWTNRGKPKQKPEPRRLNPMRMRDGEPRLRLTVLPLKEPRLKPSSNRLRPTLPVPLLKPNSRELKRLQPKQSARRKRNDSGFSTNLTRCW